MSTIHGDGSQESIPVNLPADAFDSYGRNGYFRLAEVEVFEANTGEIMVSGYSKRRGDREPARLTLDARAARLLAASLTAIVGAKCATFDCSNLVEADSSSPYCPDCNGLVSDDEAYDDGKVLIAGVLYDNETGDEADEDGPPPDLNREGDPTLNGAFG